VSRGDAVAEPLPPAMMRRSGSQGEMLSPLPKKPPLVPSRSTLSRESRASKSSIALVSVSSRKEATFEATPTEIPGRENVLYTENLQMGEASDGEDSDSQSGRGHQDSVLCTCGPDGNTSISLNTAYNAQSLKRSRTPKTVKGACTSWTLGEILGRGSWGSVFKAKNLETEEIFAVKEVRIDQKHSTDVKYLMSLENEININRELKHPHIVSYYGHDYIDNILYIYLEYMPGGSVSQVLSQFGPFNESLIAKYSRQILEGLQYLHSRQPVVLHRDIKGANILIGPPDCSVKLSDFGCSKRAVDTMVQTLRGSIPWMAPEVMLQSGYGRRSDVWSLGCVVIEMATARHPWDDFSNTMAAMLHIGTTASTPPIPQALSEACQSFIRRCTLRDKNLRPLAADLLQDEFVQAFSVSDLVA